MKTFAKVLLAVIALATTTTVPSFAGSCEEADYNYPGRCTPTGLWLMFNDPFVPSTVSFGKDGFESSISVGFVGEKTVGGIFVDASNHNLTIGDPPNERLLTWYKGSIVGEYYTITWESIDGYVGTNYFVTSPDITQIGSIEIGSVNKDIVYAKYNGDSRTTSPFALQ